MSDVLQRIKRAVFAGRYQFTDKALAELDADGLIETDAAESILTAVSIHKTIRSTSPYRSRRREYLHVIQSTNFEGAAIYTKGKLVADRGVETYYFLVSAKRAMP